MININLKPIFAFMGMQNRREVTKKSQKKKKERKEKKERKHGETITCTKLYTAVSCVRDIIVPVSLNQIKNSVI
jgi:hypothetical protein